MERKPLSYKEAGVDIDTADAAKRRMAEVLGGPRGGVLNALGAFGSLIDGRFAGYDNPVLVLKMEEPGSKQLLAVKHGRLESLCRDLVHHIVNDVAVMGAEPVAMLDTIVCGKLEQEVVVGLVDGLSRACRELGFSLVGGETSEQPGVLEPGTYVLSAALVGVVEKARVIDGSRIRPGDALLAIASNGLHTNGYTLVRRLLTDQPALAEAPVETAAGGTEPFLEAVLRPHLCYLPGLRPVFADSGLHGLAHITGGGIRDNLRRILPREVDARVDLGSIRILPVFRTIRRAGSVPDADMLRTFNMGVGMVAVVEAGAEARIREALAAAGYDAYALGRVEPGTGDVHFDGELRW